MDFQRLSYLHDLCAAQMDKYPTVLDSRVEFFPLTMIYSLFSIKNFQTPFGFLPQVEPSD